MKLKGLKDKEYRGTEDKTPTQEWERYKKVQDLLIARNLYADYDKAHNFMEGKQWGNNAPADTPLITVNIIEPIVKLKVAQVAMNNFQINFEYKTEDKPIDDFASVVCSKISKKITQAWEYNNMDAMLWDFIEEAAISSGAYKYFYFDPETRQIIIEIKAETEVMLGDEQQQDLQKQPYIIIPFRQSVADIKAQAEANGIPKEEYDRITGDDETEYQPGEFAKDEVQNDDEYDKAMCLLYMYKDRKTNTVHITKSTRCVRYMEDTDLKTAYYPLTYNVWKPVKGSARGKGEVLNLIGNQVEINKNYSRWAVIIRQTAFPKIAYNSEFIDNPKSIETVGTAIAINGNGVTAQKINDIISYLEPAKQSPEVEKFILDITKNTKDFSGAGDVVLGNINPEHASGKAILAVSDNQSMLNNIHITRAKKCIEDDGRVMFDIFAKQLGIDEILTPDELRGLSPEMLPDMKKQVQKILDDSIRMRIRVDATPTTPYSRFAEVASLEAYMLQDKITFEEFVEVLPDNSVIPKDKFKQILKTRQFIMGLVQQIQTMQAEKQRAVEIGTQLMQRGANKINELSGKSAPKQVNSQPQAV